MIILDTNVVSEFFRPAPSSRVVTWLESVTDDVAITTVTMAELLAGVRRLPDGRRKSRLSAAVESALASYRETRAIVGFDESAARAYARVFIARERAGLPVSTADAQIAAICLSNDATCATRNTGDFEFTGVHLVNPWTD